MPDRESYSVSRRGSILAIGQVNLQRSNNRISQALGRGNAFSWQCFSSIHQVRASLSALYRLHGVAKDSAQHPGGKKRRSSLSASQLVQTQHGLHGIPSPKGIRVGGDSFVVGCVSNVCEALSSIHSTKKNGITNAHTLGTNSWLCRPEYMVLTQFIESLSSTNTHLVNKQTIQSKKLK